MSTNHAAGPDRSRPTRSHGRRNKAADTRVRVARFNATLAVEHGPPGLGRYFGPLFLPDAVVGAVFLSVATVPDRRLPELDAFKVGARRVGVVLHARALLDLFHVGAGLGVRGRLAKGDRLVGLDLGG